jgi:hypothetical protein
MVYKKEHFKQSDNYIKKYKIIGKITNNIFLNMLL